MPTIYISDRGDDKNDGLSLKTPVYSLSRPRNCKAAKTIIAGTSGLARGSASKKSSPTKRGETVKGARPKSKLARADLRGSGMNDSLSAAD